MIILISFFQCIAYEKMVLVISGPVIFGTIGGYTTGIAGVFHVLRRIGLKMLRVRAIRGTFDGRSALTHGRRGGLLHDMKEVVGLEENTGADLIVLVGGMVTRGGYLGGERWGRNDFLLTTEHGKEGAL